VASAYDRQFHGATTFLPAATHVWRADTEPKYRFFHLACPPQQSINCGQHGQEELALQPNVSAMLLSATDHKSPAVAMQLHLSSLECNFKQPQSAKV
jgi:hypothetical protein